MCRYSITAITPPCHGEDAGSIPVTCSKRNNDYVYNIVFFLIIKRKRPKLVWPFLLFYKLSPKSSLNFLTSFSCQSPIGANLPKKKRSIVGSSTNFNPPIR